MNLYYWNVASIVLYCIVNPIHFEVRVKSWQTPGDMRSVFVVLQRERSYDGLKLSFNITALVEELWSR